MKLLLMSLLVIFSLHLNAQVEVNAGNIREHIGDSVKYCGKVVAARLMDRMRNAPVFLNMDAAYPKQVLTVVIWEADRLKFSIEPQVYYTDRNVCVYGRLETFRDLLQVVVRSENQIVIQP